jgi:hypothetical protein
MPLSEHTKRHFPALEWAEMTSGPLTHEAVAEIMRQRLRIMTRWALQGHWAYSAPMHDGMIKIYREHVNDTRDHAAGSVANI